jgi:carboxyl-terminal processing protease
VQNLLPLARLMEQSGLSYAYDPGALKITIRKFYRPGGSSTQLKGVASDIVLPSPTDALKDVSESSLTNPLAWDSVPASKFQPVNRVQRYLPALKESSSRRVAADSGFNFLKEEIALIKKSLAEKSISLNEAERRKEVAEAKARKEKREEQTKQLQAAKATTYEIKLKNASSPGLPAPVAVAGKTAQVKTTAPGKDKDDDEPGLAPQETLADKVTLNEGVQILADYVRMLKEGSALKNAQGAQGAQ